MRGRSLLVVLTLVVLLALATAGAVRAELPDGAMVLDPDIVWDTTDPNCAVISPDGKKIAYVSKGAIWCCEVTGGTPRKLAELPNTPTDFMSRPEYAYARSNFGLIRRALGNVVYNQTISLEEAAVYSLRWTPSQDGVVYVIQDRRKSSRGSVTYDVMHATNSGVATNVAPITRSSGAEPDRINFHVTADKRHIVVSAYGEPLIWDAANGRPMATSFDYLIPSSTSNRYLGIEIDTRELVLVDENFRVAKRYGVVLEQRRRADLFWSPDERFAVCRRFRDQQEQLSDNCSAVLIDLETGEIRELGRGVEKDGYAFTSAGEVIRIGVRGIPPRGYGDGTYGAYLRLTKGIRGEEREICGFSEPGPRTTEWHRAFYPVVLHDASCSLFAMALPRGTGELPGFHYHLIERDGRVFPFPGGDESKFISPFVPIALASGDQWLVGRTETQLFSVPLAKLRAAAEAERD